ncbi:MAG: VanZ family protein [Lachnospiraceae bacterium]|nr:VanZ family protein [Lachnospiraceae bacterium]
MRVQDIINLSKEYVLFGAVAGVAAVLFLAIGYFVIYRKVLHGTRRLSRLRMLWWAVFCCYMVVLIGATVLSRSSGAWNDRKIVGLFVSYKDAWISGTASAWRNLVLNILLFVPLGFLLPLGWRRFRVFWKTSLFGLILTVMIECFQLIFSFGLFEMDDIFNNLLGAMIGYGFYELWRVVAPGSGKEKNVKWCLAAQLPLLLAVCGFAVLGFCYQNQELGNLSVTCISPYKTAQMTISTNQTYSSESRSGMVYRIRTCTLEETAEIAQEMFELLGTAVDESRTDVYDNSVFYYSLDADYILTVDFLGGTYDLTDFSTTFYHSEDADQPTQVYQAEEADVKKVLETYGIELPEGAVFSESDGTYSFTADRVMDGDNMWDGTLSCTLYDNGRCGYITNYFIECEPYKEFSLISEQEAYEEICAGKFVSGVINADSVIEVGEVRMEYLADTKGFYQPIWVFEVTVDGSDAEICIRALK